MKIVLAIEKQAGQPATEVTFSQPKIKFGRDANNCEVFFDNQEFRMVSRHHADIRFSKGTWMVGDVGSSFGTYLNGAKLQKPSQISVGSTIQFGEGGPRAHVIWLEGNGQQIPAEAPEKKVEPQQEVPVVPSAKPAVPQERPQVPPPSVEKPKVPQKPPVLKLDGATRQTTVDKQIFWLGRDPHCDFVIEESAVMVSRRHANIENSRGSFFLQDNQSFNGTLINEKRISSSTQLYNGDKIRLGFGGPVLTFYLEGGESRQSAGPAAKAPSGHGTDLQEKPAPDYSGTMVFNIPTTAGKKAAAESPRQLLASIGFEGAQELTIGRDPASHITLDGLQISNNHARLKQTDAGVVVEDLNSTNGVYVNGERVSRKLFVPGDSVQIGAFVIETDEYGHISVFDTRSKTRIDAQNISKQVKDRSGGGKILLLDNISLSIQPNEFVGLLGPSGAGKSTFMDALNGMRPPSKGKVFVNGLDLYGYLDSLKQSIGYVPQDEILHPGLKVSDTLYYIAKLRLSRDVSRTEIDQIIDEVLDVTGLTERRNVAIEELSGGQRKRVSIAVELITKPSVIYLDEPTSGLDPTTEEKIMLLFRQIAESGRTVILTTHAMENVRLFDKIVLLMRGKLVFYGSPTDALAHFGAGSFKELFEKLEEPVEDEISNSVDDRRFEVSERVAAGWRSRFEETKHYEENVRKPLEAMSGTEVAGSRSRHRLGLFGAIRQFATLSQRYLQVLLKDKFNLFILFVQAPVIAILVFFVMGANQPRDFAYFALSLCAIWFGTSVAAREIVRERKIYERERMVNLGILPYLASKYVILGTIVALQCLMLFLPLKFFDLTGLMPMPGVFAGIPQFFAMLLTAAVGIALGLFVSAIVKTSETATSLIPLILIPQIIFSGLIGLPTGINKVVGLAMPASWSFDTMKRFSDLDTLEPEGAFQTGTTDGKGLYKSIESKNDRIISEAKENIRDYEKDLEKKLQDAERRAANGEQVRYTGLPDRPEVGDAVKIPKDLSPYISFLHPWMHEILNPLVLIFMFLVLFLATVSILKLQDFV